MSRSRIGFLLAATALVAAVGPQGATASTPPSHEVTVPTQPGEVVRVEWTGTIGPGATGILSECNPADPAADRHTIELDVPAGTYDSVAVRAEFTITWTDPGNDEVLTVIGPEDTASSDGGSPQETVFMNNPAAGTYTVLACPFLAATPQAYSGFLELTVTADPPLPAADAQGLLFSATVPTDIQRDQGEPLVEVDGNGRIYVCGNTGFSNVNDYAQVSTDGADQFHLLGEPPRGQISVGEGGGDCAIATGPVDNAEGFRPFAYAGLGPLTNFSTAVSDDGAQTLVASPVSESVPGVDRQWTAFTDADTVFLNYNQVAPRAVTVQRSDDGGFTYGPPRAVSPNPGFPGPIRTMPAALNPAGNGKPVVYYPWSQGTAVRLAVSLDEGENWSNCTAAEAIGQPDTLFPVMDHDLAGNVYLAYVDSANFNAYMTHLANADLLACTDRLVNAGFSAPVKVNRDKVLTTVFPWIVASGLPGRVAVSFYGSESGGSPETAAPKTFTWNVYVNQSLNALEPDATFSQVKATTHPNHYDQVCLRGIACTTGGDRSLVDFFSIDLDPTTGALVVAYQQAHKRPGDAAGTVSSPMAIHQVAGPSNLGGFVAKGDLPIVRRSSTDPAGDAIADFSSLYTPPSPVNVPAADLLSHTIDRAVDPRTGVPSPGGGFTVTMRVTDLSPTALSSALLASKAQSLLWIFRYVDGFRYSAAVASWNPVQGFRFGHNGYKAAPGECQSALGGDDPSFDQCLLYTADTPIAGAVDPVAGTITMTVPLSVLNALKGTQGPGQTPTEIDAKAGDRIYDAAAFSQANPTSPTPQVHSWLVPLDNTPAMDFRIPVSPKPKRPG